MAGTPASAQARGRLAGGYGRARGRKAAVTWGLLRGAYAAMYRRRPRWEEAPCKYRSCGADLASPAAPARAARTTSASRALRPAPRRRWALRRWRARIWPLSCRPGTPLLAAERLQPT